jgi:hypothetical protein
MSQRQRIEHEVREATQRVQDEEAWQERLQMAFQASEVELRRLQAKLLALQRLLAQLSR